MLTDHGWRTDDVLVAVVVAVAVAVSMSVSVSMSVVWKGWAGVPWVCWLMNVVHSDANSSPLAGPALSG